MSTPKSVAGMRVFLYAILQLIHTGEFEHISSIQEHLSTGIATYLYHKHKDTFDSIGVSTSNLCSIDEHYRQWNGVSLGCEEKYVCAEDDGLYLLIKLELNNIY